MGGGPEAKKKRQKHFGEHLSKISKPNPNSREITQEKENKLL